MRRGSKLQREALALAFLLLLFHSLPLNVCLGVQQPCSQLLALVVGTNSHGLLMEVYHYYIWTWFWDAMRAGNIATRMITCRRRTMHGCLLHRIDVMFRIIIHQSLRRHLCHFAAHRTASPSNVLSQVINFTCTLPSALSSSPLCSAKTASLCSLPPCLDKSLLR